MFGINRELFIGVALLSLCVIPEGRHEARHSTAVAEARSCPKGFSTMTRAFFMQVDSARDSITTCKQTGWNRQIMYRAAG